MGKHWIGEIVKIVGNTVDHGFQIGEEVRIIGLDENGDVDVAEKLDGSDDWFMFEEDIEKITI